YTQQWRDEAAARGLPNNRETVSALAPLGSKKAADLFAKYSVLTKKELSARASIFFEKYNKQTVIEGRSMVSVARRWIMPAALDHQTSLAQAVAAAEQVGLDSGDLREELNRIATLVARLRDAIGRVEDAIAHSDDAPQTEATHLRDKAVPAMVGLREAADELEQHLPDGMWPLPTYREMLFIK